MLNIEKLKREFFENKPVIVNKKDPNKTYKKESDMDYILNKQRYKNYKIQQIKFIINLLDNIITKKYQHDNIIKKNFGKTIYFDGNLNIYFREIEDYWYKTKIDNMYSFIKEIYEKKEVFEKYLLIYE